MARPKTIYNKEEVEEIIKLKLESLMGIRKKMSPNSVWNYNKSLIEQQTICKSTGEVFKLYGYQFWCVDGYGKQRIEEIRSEEEDFILVGKSFKVELQDIAILVDKFHNKPSELTSRLMKIFEKDRSKIKMLEQQNTELNNKLNNARQELEVFQKSFMTIFMASQSQTNSLDDVCSLKKSDDKLINDELKSMFNGGLDISIKQKITDRILDISDLKHKNRKEDRKKQVEDDWFS